MRRSKYTGKKEGLSEKERIDVWELVSSCNRLGFVLHNYPRVFLFLSLNTKFLKWDAERVIDRGGGGLDFMYIKRELTSRKEVK